MKIRILITNLSLGARNAKHKSNLVALISELMREVDPAIVLAQEAGRILPLAGYVNSLVRDLSHYNSANAKDYLGQIAEMLRTEFQLLSSPSILQHPAKKQRAGVGHSEVWAQGNCIFLNRKVPWEPKDLWTRGATCCAYVEELQLPRIEGNYFYLGSRSSEPRIAQFIRISIGEQQFVFVNVHLTTLDGERAGNDNVDQQARDLRAKQLDEIVAGLSALRAYSQTADSGTEETPADVFFLGGDFNETYAVLNGHSGLMSIFDPALITAQTRPGNRLSVDNAFITKGHSHMVHDRKVLVTSATKRAMPNKHDYDDSYGPLIDQMEKNGVDHWPILVELEV